LIKKSGGRTVAKKNLTSDILLAFVSDETSEEVIKQLPLADFGLNLLIFRGSVKNAYEYLKTNHSPRILLVDITGCSLPISEVAALAEVCEPGVEVVSIGETNDISIFRGLLNLGVRDYIVKPLSPSLLVRSFENILYSEKKTEKTTGFSRLGSVISFIGMRGGVGTSTLAANSAWLLSEHYHKLIYLSSLGRFVIFLIYLQRLV
jgi:pilus assembly protein CpaE